jgi:hypothetical protein
MPVNKKNHSEFISRRDFSNQKINSFKEVLQNLRWENVLNSNDVNESYENFWGDFNTLYELHFPVKIVKFNKNVHKINGYMTKGLLTSRRNKVALHKKTLLNPDMYLLTYRNYRNLYNSLIRASKKMYIEENFKKYQKNPKKTWDFFKKTTFGETQKVKIGEIFSNNKSVTSDNEIAEEFNKFFSSIGTKISAEIPNVTKDPVSYINDYDANKPKFYFDIPGPVHICDVVKSFASKSSIDSDGISLKFVKSIIDVICVPLAHVFKLSLEQGIFPDKLKYSRVVPIFKMGDNRLCDNYRPITLVSTFSKILEKIVAVRLTNHLELNNLLYKNQYGFLRNTSTEHNLVQVVNFISNAINNGNYCVGVFLDLKKAFDVCSHDILLKKLIKFGIDENQLKWFSSYLKNRFQRVDINGRYSSDMQINISVMQGTILGQILFLCYINDIHTATKLFPCYLLMTHLV